MPKTTAKNCDPSRTRSKGFERKESSKPMGMSGGVRVKQKTPGNGKRDG